MLMETRQTFVPPADTVVTSSGEMMFTDFMKMWLEVAKSTIKLTTYASYAAIVNNRIVPYFEPKNLKLSEVTATDIQVFYLWLLEQMTSNSVRPSRRAISPTVSTALGPIFRGGLLMMRRRRTLSPGLWMTSR